MSATVRETARGYTLECNGVRVNFLHVGNIIKYARMLGMRITWII